MLAMGGIALGKAVESSGLLNLLAQELTPLLQNYSVFTCTMIVAALVVVVTSFISHTVGALILLPVIAKIGMLLPDPRPRTLVMAAALMCSGGMCLPVSSFPNMNAISLEDSRGVPWLTVKDFLLIGVISSALAWISCVTIGYSIMSFIDFQ
jgi:di/tricarboxylate transporter